jgi:hypothetical protein
VSGRDLIDGSGLQKRRVPCGVELPDATRRPPHLFLWSMHGVRPTRHCERSEAIQPRTEGAQTKMRHMALTHAGLLPSLRASQ